jgi:hypothetical protein
VREAAAGRVLSGRQQPDSGAVLKDPGQVEVPACGLHFGPWMASVAVMSQLPAWMAASSPALIPATRALMSYWTVRPSRIVAAWRPSTRTATAGSAAAVTWCLTR